MRTIKNDRMNKKIKETLPCNKKFTNSPRYAWPDVCRPSFFPITIVDPISDMRFSISITRDSLPGITYHYGLESEHILHKLLEIVFLQQKKFKKSHEKGHAEKSKSC